MNLSSPQTFDALAVGARGATPLVSVVMSVHNGGDYLEPAIRSILRQSFGDLELVIVDDASDDGSDRVIASISDARLVMLRNSSRLGLTRSLNRALAVARGVFIARLDADDVALPHRLERQLAFMDGRPNVDLCATWTLEIDGDGKPIGAHEVDPSPAWLLWELCGGNVFYHSTMLFRREAVRAIGGYNEAMPYAQDHDLVVRFVMAGRKVAVLPERLIEYRRRPGQLTQTRAAEQAACGASVRSRFLGWLLGRELSPELIEAFRQVMGWLPIGSEPAIDQAIAALPQLQRAIESLAAGEGVGTLRRRVRERLLKHSRHVLDTQQRLDRSSALLACAFRSDPGAVVHRACWREAMRLVRRSVRRLTPSLVRRPT